MSEIRKAECCGNCVSWDENTRNSIGGFCHELDSDSKITDKCDEYKWDEDV